MARTTKAVTASRAEDLDAGTSKHFTNPAELLRFAGSSMAVSDLTTKLQRVATLRANAIAAQAAAQEAVAAEDAELPGLQVLMTQYTAFVRVTFGNAATTLGDFGLAPTKVAAAPDVETQVVAVAKRTATREARHTRGPKARLAIKGNVTGVSITPVTAAEGGPSSPAPAPAPAPGGA